ncbi:MAG TPA: HypC/HybG/HupF family hydrogenase formation chaperone [Candidatus Brocadiia bacterium]|nr:HypC/HybG/HupF family hydrogenase formation chaperone [Candidatus Brocadiales bacterium]
MKLIKNNGVTGVAELGGLEREIGLQLLENVKVGDYVIVHAGYAIQKLDEKEAAETVALLEGMRVQGRIAIRPCILNLKHEIYR